MSEGERNYEFEKLFEQLCIKLESLRIENPPPKKTVHQIIGPIVNDIIKIHENEVHLLKWKKQPPDFSIEEKIVELENDVFTWLQILYTDGILRDDILLLGQSAQVHPSLILRFLYDYLHKNAEYSFDRERFTSLWNKLLELNNSEKFVSIIRIPLCNFYMLEKELSKNNITCRLVNLEKNEYYYFLIQLLGEQPLVHLGSLFGSINPHAKLGLLTPYVIEIKYEYTKQQEEEYMNEFVKALVTEPIFINGDVHLSKEMLLNLETFNNPRIQNLVDSARQIEKYLEMALQIFKTGDVRIFGIIQEGTFNNQIVDRALFSLEKKDFNKLRIPYCLNEEEFYEFLDFWNDFYPQIINISDYYDVITILYDTQSDDYDSIYYNYFKALEILFANDFTNPRQKSTAFKRRITKFFLEHKYPPVYLKIIADLKIIRNQKAHEGFVDSQKIDDLGKTLFQSRHVDYIILYNKVKDIIRIILKDFWFMLRKFSYEQAKLREYLDD